MHSIRHLHIITYTYNRTLKRFETALCMLFFGTQAMQGLGVLAHPSLMKMWKKLKQLCLLITESLLERLLKEKEFHTAPAKQFLLMF